ncbi:hypothetical protein H6792_00410 [Candidatus Nomurabacteria bacterium]|nr:hypothetical protein [Candidatus Nomurabacteria bacterium]
MNKYFTLIKNADSSLGGQFTSLIATTLLPYQLIAYPKQNQIIWDY